MKTIFITLFTIATFIFNADTDTVTATFIGFSEDTYYFEDEDELMHSFEAVTEEVSKEFDLTNNTYKGKTFKVTYVTSSEMNEDDEEYDMLTITGLELIK